MNTRTFVFVTIVSLLAAGAASTPALAQDAGPDAPTFARDVAPILQRSCQACHRTGSMAPMSLVTYQEVRPWARAIREKVAGRIMPPWHLDPRRRYRRGGPLGRRRRAAG